MKEDARVDAQNALYAIKTMGYGYGQGEEMARAARYVESTSIARQSFEEAYGRLAEEMTELGILAEELFKNAAAALYGPEPELALAVMENEPACARMRQSIHEQALTLLARHSVSPEGTRSIAELQAIATEFARIGENARQIAEHALLLGGMGDMELLRVGGDAPHLLMELVRQAYIEMRGGVLASTTHDTALARRLMKEDIELDSLFIAFKHLLDQEIARNPRNVTPLHRLLLVGVALEEIGNHVAAICKTLLYRPQSQ